MISPPIETSRFERVAPRGREAAALRRQPPQATVCLAENFALHFDFARPTKKFF
jgi:uncharacterized protein (DUF1501 family)